MVVGRERVTAALLIGIAWLFTLTRIIPTQIGDRGIFVSVAERIAAGDRLYVDVWDNKDPLFYLTLGLGRTVSPYTDIVLEVGWILAACIAAFSLARSTNVSVVVAAVIGFAGTPVILTGAEYLAGFTHLPGSVLLLVVMALAMRGRLLVAGLLLVALGLFKLVMLPLALVAISVILVRRRSTWPIGRSLLRIAIGVVVALVVAVALLALRGELGAYVESLMLNAAYSQSMQDQSTALPLVGLLGKVMTTAATTTLLAIVSVLAVVRLNPRRPEPVDALWWTLMAVLITAMAVTAVTGLWPHHSQILYGPAVLALVLASALVSSLERAWIAGWVALGAAALLLAGAPSPQLVADSVLSAPTRLRALDDLAPATVDLLSTGAASSYARVGLNDELGHARGLGDWRLACPKFHQYEYDPEQTFDQLTSCIPDVPWLIVGSSLAPEPGYPRWNDFVNTVEQTLAEEFTCEQRAWGRLCRHV
jgi:hypothetical protein